MIPCINLKRVIEQAWEQRATLTPETASAELCDVLNETLYQLDRGIFRVASKVPDTEEPKWDVHQWLKKAILLSFRTQKNQCMSAGGYTQFYDKVNSKFTQYTEADFIEKGFRVVPPAFVRHGAFIEKNVVLMPSYVNVGAYVDEGAMIDSWATIGSCAQIGKKVHISSQVVIGGVLEPLQANPVIIEDYCFVGAGASILEGVVVGEYSVIATGVCLSQSTKILDRSTGKILMGVVPPGSVVVPGTLPASNGQYSVAAAIIVKKVDAKTREKTSINALLRDE